MGRCGGEKSEVGRGEGEWYARGRRDDGAGLMKR